MLSSHAFRALTILGSGGASSFNSVCLLVCGAAATGLSLTRLSPGCLP
jgi:hypothetical protein